MNKSCVIDIDGVLNYYPETWLDFVADKTGFFYNNLHDMKNEISYNEYTKLKEEYRNCGIKENLKVREGAVELLDYLKSIGYYIIITTARPVNLHQNLMSQTSNWLKKNKLDYDNLFFSFKKHLTIVEYFKSIDFAIEDNRYYINDIAEMGYKGYLVDNIYNQGDVEEKVVRVKNLKEIEDDLKCR
jgi:uncharacterized HAD superfamily protein